MVRKRPALSILEWGKTAPAKGTASEADRKIMAHAGPGRPEFRRSADHDRQIPLHIRQIMLIIREQGWYSQGLKPLPAPKPVA